MGRVKGTSILNRKKGIATCRSEETRKSNSITRAKRNQKPKKMFNPTGAIAIVKNTASTDHGQAGGRGKGITYPAYLPFHSNLMSVPIIGRTQ